MLSLTKVFRFETAHAILGYNGACKNIHGHSYILEVTVCDKYFQQQYIPAPGLLIDFKEIKAIVNNKIVAFFDHYLILSEAYLAEQPQLNKQQQLRVVSWEPTAENMLLFIEETLKNAFPSHVELYKLRLFETADSFAEWQNLV